LHAGLGSWLGEAEIEERDVPEEFNAREEVRIKLYYLITSDK
jgi:hypothetical protein